MSSTIRSRARTLTTRFAAAANKNRALAAALADALTEAESERPRFTAPNFSASVRRVARAVGVNATNWATPTYYGDNLECLVVDYEDPKRGFIAPWLVEQHYPYRDYATDNTFTCRKLNVRTPYDAQLIYNAYDGVSPIVKAAETALTEARRRRSVR